MSERPTAFEKMRQRREQAEVRRRQAKYEAWCKDSEPQRRNMESAFTEHLSAITAPKRSARPSPRPWWRFWG